MNEIKYRTFFVKLPSGGKIYSPESPLSEGEIELKYGTAQEENILVSRAYIQKGIVFNKLLDALIIDKSINQSDLLLGDRNALLIAARQAMYGTEYKYFLECPRCDEKTNNKCDLSEFEPFNLNWDNISENKFEFKSSLDTKFIYKLLTYGEDQELDKRNKKLKNLNLYEGNTELTDRLSASVISINGNNDRNNVINYIKTMASIESKELRENMLQNTPDIDMSKEFTCSNCGYSNFLDIPIDVNFFWNTGRRR